MKSCEDADAKYDLEYEISPLAPQSLTASESHYREPSRRREPYRYVWLWLSLRLSWAQRSTADWASSHIKTLQQPSGKIYYHTKSVEFSVCQYQQRQNSQQSLVYLLSNGPLGDSLWPKVKTFERQILPVHACCMWPDILRNRCHRLILSNAPTTKFDS